MPEPVYLGFDFGYKRIGVAVGQRLTGAARPLATLKAQQGIPEWASVARLIQTWQPHALIVGVPTCINGNELYTTALANAFADALSQRFACDVHRVDERLTTVEARAQLFADGGYRKIKSSEIDSLAACIILEQWLST